MYRTRSIVDSLYYYLGSRSMKSRGSNYMDQIQTESSTANVRTMIPLTSVQGINRA